GANAAPPTPSTAQVAPPWQSSAREHAAPGVSPPTHHLRAATNPAEGSAHSIVVSGETTTAHPPSPAGLPSRSLQPDGRVSFRPATEPPTPTSDSSVARESEVAEQSN